MCTIQSRVKRTIVSSNMKYNEMIIVTWNETHTKLQPSIKQTPEKPEFSASNAPFPSKIFHFHIYTRRIF